VRCGLRSAVLGKWLAQVDTNYAARHDNFSSFASRVILHKVCCKRGAIYRALEVDVGAGGIRLWR
jgi:hypothetical protein